MPGRRHVRSEPEQHDDAEREEQLLAQVRGTERACEGGEHWVLLGGRAVARRKSCNPWKVNAKAQRPGPPSAVADVTSARGSGARGAAHTRCVVVTRDRSLSRRGP